MCFFVLRFAACNHNYVNLHIKFISFGNFIGGVLQILCEMKLVSYKMPSQILR